MHKSFGLGLLVLYQKLLHCLVEKKLVKNFRPPAQIQWLTKSQAALNPCELCVFGDHEVRMHKPDRKRTILHVCLFIHFRTCHQASSKCYTDSITCKEYFSSHEQLNRLSYVEPKHKQYCLNGWWYVFISGHCCIITKQTVELKQLVHNSSIVFSLSNLSIYF